MKKQIGHFDVAASSPKNLPQAMSLILLKTINSEFFKLLSRFCFTTKQLVHEMGINSMTKSKISNYHKIFANGSNIKPMRQQGCSL